MAFPTDIKDAADYLDGTFVERATLRGADLAALRESAEATRRNLLRLARNDYQRELVNGGVSAVIEYMKRGKMEKRDARQIMLAAVERLRNAPAFGPKDDES
jgi:hypothetical protein